MKVLRFCLSLLLLTLFLEDAALAQSQTGRITGRIIDSTQSPVPNAKLTLKSVAMEATRVVQSGDDGLYTFVELNPGVYELTTEAKGFQTFIRKNISVDIGATIRVDLELSVGAFNEQMTVTAEPALINNETATNSTTFIGREVSDVPVLTHNPGDLALATAGSVALNSRPFDVTLGDYAVNTYAFNGGRANQTLFIIDGISVIRGDTSQDIITPASEASHEVQVITNTFDVQYGKTDGSVVTLATKSGSTNFHGSGFEYVRNARTDANTWVNDRSGLPKPAYRFNVQSGEKNTTEIVEAAKVGDHVYARKSTDPLPSELSKTALDDVEKSLGEL